MGSVGMAVESSRESSVPEDRVLWEAADHLLLASTLPPQMEE